MENLENFDKKSMIIEYLWKPTKYRVTRRGFVVTLEKPIKKGQKIAVLFAGVHKDSPNKVCVGYSMCHSNLDNFNIVRVGTAPEIGYIVVEDPDFGKKIAAGRAVKWSDKSDPVEQTIKCDQPQTAAPIPASIYKEMKRFAGRVVSYYKDKQLPEWVVRLNES